MVLLYFIIKADSMYNKIINEIEYTNVIYEDKPFIVQFIKNPRNKSKYNNKYRLVNTEGNKDCHTHLNNLGVCKKCILFVSKKKLPLTAQKYIIKSCYRLSIDEDYKEKVLDLYNRKRKKQSYYNNNPISR